MNEELSRRRAVFEARLDDVREASESSFGWLPRGARWVLPLTAAAVGLLAGLTVARALQRRDKKLLGR
ncbi:MAG: hypothetical protein U0X73_04430 [Thermoanaerobaculia bacterium]